MTSIEDIAAGATIVYQRKSRRSAMCVTQIERVSDATVYIQGIPVRIRDGAHLSGTRSVLLSTTDLVETLH